MPAGGVTTYYLTQFLPKTAWKWKKLERKTGGRGLKSQARPYWIRQCKRYVWTRLGCAWKRSTAAKCLSCTRNYLCTVWQQLFMKISWLIKNTKNLLKLFQNKSLFTECHVKSVNIYIMFEHRVGGQLITSLCCVKMKLHTLTKRGRCFWVTKTLCKISTREMCPQHRQIHKTLDGSHLVCIIVLFWSWQEEAAAIFLLVYSPNIPHTFQQDSLGPNH